jgi:4-carboxymuconolactone decarboxylase
MTHISAEMLDPAERRARGEQLHLAVMQAPPPPADSPLGAAMLDFVMAEIWSRPGLDRRSRRWIALTCVGAADAEARSTPSAMRR